MLNKLIIKTKLRGIYGTVEYERIVNVPYDCINEIERNLLSMECCKLKSFKSDVFYATTYTTLIPSYCSSAKMVEEFNDITFGFITEEIYYKAAKLKKLDDLKSAIISSSIKHSNTTKEDI